MDINRKAKSYLTTHKYQKRKTFFTALLSVLMVFCVVSSLIMPAVSMTIDAVQEFVVEQEDAKLVKAPQSIIVNDKEMLDISSANSWSVMISKNNRLTELYYYSYPSSENNYNNFEQQNFTSDMESLDFEINYTFIDSVKDFLFDDAGNAKEGPHLALQLCSSNNSSFVQINDGNVIDGNFNTSVPAGNFVFKDGYILVTLTDTYLNYVNDGNGDIQGALNFTGNLGRANNEDGDQTLNIGGQEITVPFQDHYAEISSKSGQITNPSDGTITWTVTIDNPYGADLSQYTFSDDMLGSATSVTFNPPNAGSFDETSKKIQLSGTDSWVQITYITPITESQMQAGSANNTATLSKGDHTSSQNGNVELDNPFDLTKTGTQDYKDGTYGNKINWTIRVKNNYGVSLEDYILEDTNIPASGVTVSPQGSLISRGNGKWQLDNVNNASEVTITYQTDATEGSNQNNVTLYYSSETSTGKTATSTVNYQKESDLINYSKNVTSYNADTHQIGWTIQVTPVQFDDGSYVSLKDYYLIDNAFAGKSVDDLSFNPNSVQNANGEWVDIKTLVQLNNITLTFTDDIRTPVTITYTTDVSFDNVTQNDNEITVSNSIRDEYDTTDTVVTTKVSVRNNLSKYLTEMTTTEVASNGIITDDLTWNVDLTWDGKFAGKAYTDTLSVTGNGASHIITDAQINEIVITAGVYQANEKTLMVGTDYTVSKNSDGKGFTITFKDTLDTAGYNHVKITYNTTYTASAVGDNASYPITYTFKNEGSFNGKTGEGTFTLNRTNPEKYETSPVTVQKTWVNVDDTQKEEVTVQLYYKSKLENVPWDETNSTWKEVRTSNGTTPLFEGDEGYDLAGVYTLTLNAVNNWSVSLGTLNFPHKTATADEDGNQTETTIYCYGVVEKNVGDVTIPALADGAKVPTSDYQYGYKNPSNDTNGIYVLTYRNSGNTEYANGIEDGTLEIVNTYYRNISVIPQKIWSTNNGGSTPEDNFPVTVQLQRNDGSGVWTEYKAVLESSGDAVSTQTLSASNNWTGIAWKDLPIREIAADGTVISYTYRVVETQINGIAVPAESNGKSISLGEAGYVTINDYDSNGTDTNGTYLQVTNTYYPSNLTITAQKFWSDETHKLSGAIVQLQQKAGNSNAWINYTPDGQQTLNDSNSWTYEWKNLPNHTTDASGNVIPYSYRVIEVGVVNDDNTVTFSEAVLNNRKFAVSEDGYYEISYSTNQLDHVSGTVHITNTYKSAETTSITPQKVWKGDSAFASQRPTTVTFELQQRIDNGEWETVMENDSPKRVTITPTDSTASTWTGAVISDLLSKQIVLGEDGAFTERNYSYRFVEVVNVNGEEQVLDEGDSFSVTYTDIDGKYKVFINDGTITNTFEENIGIDKRIIDSNGHTITSIEKEELTNFKKTIDGVEYYVFNWVIEYDGNKPDLITQIVDTLPTGFTLCTDDDTWSGQQLYWKTPSDTDETSAITGKGLVPSDYQNHGSNKNHRLFDGYYEQPGMVWPGYGYNCAKPETSAQAVWSHWENSEWYYYDVQENKVYFNKPSMWAMMAVCYSTKIRCTDLDAELENGSYTIQNYVVKLNRDGTATDKTDVASLTIENKATSNLIHKSYSETLIPGYIQYTLDINPEAKNLSNGSTIDIEDFFKTESYFDHDYSNGQLTEGNNLIDVLMNNIQLYKYDANGNRTALAQNAYTYLFNGDGVTSDGEQGTALLKLTIPDETHISVVYTYKMIANANTPSVIHGCKSSTLENGRYATMRPGLVPPTGDRITFSNTATLKADSATAESSQNNIEYEMFRASGTISTNSVPQIAKVNTGDYTINDLVATFLLAKYDASTDAWNYASDIGARGAIDWQEDAYAGTLIPENAYEIVTGGAEPVSTALSEGTLYKLVELSVPDGYSGSNLTDANGTPLTAEQYEELIRAYLNGENTVSFGNVSDYSSFLRFYSPVHYFAYNSILDSSALPDDVQSSNVIQIKTGGDIEIPNHELVDITVNKQWIDENGNVDESFEGSVTVELYWSYTKTSSGMPEDATLATAADLGIRGTFNSTATISTGAGTAGPLPPTWSNLPNGKDDRPIYYYIQEIAYTIDDVTYTFNESTGQYVSTGGESGDYLPTYVGNGSYTSTAGSNNVTVTISNSQQLILKKEWKDSSGSELSDRYIPDDLTVSIYGIDSDYRQTEDPLVTVRFTPDADGNINWQQNITEQILAANIDFSQYTSLVAVESSSDSNFDASDFTISCVYNLNQNTGEITVTNRSTQPTEASVTVNKTWSDGADLHKGDSVEVMLYRTTEEVDNFTDLSEDELEEQYNGMAMTPETDYKATLNADNNWTYTWTGLPLDNGTDTAEATESYYYYVLETNKTVIEADAADKYIASYTATVNGAKTTYNITNTRNAIVLQKQWYDEDGSVIVKYNENGELVDAEGNVLNGADYALYDNLSATVEVYQQTVQKPTEAISVVAFGDSITDGYGEFSRNEHCYPSQLTKLLTDDGYTLSGGSISNQGVSQQQIGDENQGFRSRITSAIPSDTDIVLFLGGTNDIHQSGSSVKGDPDGVYTRFEACIEEIKTQAPNAVIFVGSIPHFDFYKNNTLTDGGNWWNWLSGYADNDGAIPNGLIDQYNAKIRAYADNSSTDNVYYVDVCSVVTDDLIRNDGCHPNAEGYTAIANAYYTAINDYYTTSDTEAFQATVILDRDNNWTAAVDVPDDGTYYVRETAPTSGWTVTYSDPSTTDAPSETPISQTAGGTVLIMNTRYTPETSLTVEKTWAMDTASDRPDSITLTLLRRVGTTGDWEEYLATPTVVKDDASGRWTFIYENLPMQDLSGNTYYYKVEETTVPEGYTVSYGENNGPDGNGVRAQDGDSAGKLTLTNTRSISLKLQKVWDDQEQAHTGDSVTVRLYRSTTAPTDTSSLALAVNPTNVSVSVGGTATVTANKTITGATFSYSTEDIATASLGEDGKTIAIEGISQGTTQITVTYKNDSGVEETATIGVTVSNLAIWLGNDNSITQLTAGIPVAISARLNNIEMSDAIFEITSGNATISNGQIIANAVRSVTIAVTVTDNTGITHTAERTVSVGYPEFSVSDVTIAQGGTMTITPPDSYGGFSYSIASSSGKITLSGNTISVASDATIGETATITVSRDGVSKTFTVTVVDESVVVSNNYFYDLEQTSDKVSKIEVTIKDISITNEWYNGMRLKLVAHKDNVNYEFVTLIEKSTNEFPGAGEQVLTFESSAWDGLSTGIALYFEAWGLEYTIVNINVTYSSGGSTTTTITTASGDTTTTTTTTVSSETPDPTPGGETVTGGPVTVDNSSNQDRRIDVGSNDISKIELELADLDNGDALHIYLGGWNAKLTLVYNGSGFDQTEVDKMSWEANGTKVTITVDSGVNASCNWNQDYNEKLTFHSNSGSFTVQSYTITYASTNTLTLAAFDLPITDEGTAVVQSEEITDGEWHTDGATGWQYRTFTIDAVPNIGDEPWTYIVQNLEPYDSSRNPYYYWAVEEPVPANYTPLYIYTDGDATQDTAINAGNLGNGTITIRNVKTQTTNITLPSTGGTGTRMYTIIGTALMGSATAAYILIRRRQKASRMQ